MKRSMLRSIVLPNGFLNNYNTIHYVAVKAGSYKGKGNLIRIKTSNYDELNIHLYFLTDEKRKRLDHLKSIIRNDPQNALVYFSNMRMNASARTCQLYLSADDFHIVNKY